MPDPYGLEDETEEERMAREALESPDSGYERFEGDPVNLASPETPEPSAATGPVTTQPVNAEAPVDVLPPAEPAPPPLPPATPPEVQDVVGETGRFALDWLNNPNRYFTDLAEKTRAAGEARLSEYEDQSGREIDEWAAGRGLIGSSYEGEQQVRLRDAMQRARGDQEVQLLRDITQAETADRSAAGQYGLDVARYGQEYALDRYQAALEERGLTGGLGIAQQDIDLRAEQLMAQREQFGESLTFEEAQRLAERELKREVELGRLGINQQDIDLRAEELRQQAAQFGETLSFEDAQAEAERSLTREIEFGRLGISQQQLDQRAEEIRLQNEQFGTRLSSENAQAEAERQLTRELELERLGISQQDINLRVDQLREAGEQFDRQITYQQARDLAERDL